MWKTIVSHLSAGSYGTVSQGLLEIQPDSTPSQTTDFNGQKSQSLASQNLLIVSPYTSRPHLLDLTNLSISQQLLARALTLLAPCTEEYATAPYNEAFNWEIVHGFLKDLTGSEEHQWREQSFYIVVFRSQVPPTTDRSRLGELDERAHVEAMKSGGLLKYWFGVPNATGRNLATCIWRKREDAKPGSSGDGHKEATRATMNMYSEWHIERIKLTVTDQAKEWIMVSWED
ncbi:MAG: hypothetical protein Q9167_005368 [Letrouitia subvulpina]